MTKIVNDLDLAIDFAIGKHRNSLYWKNTTAPFSELAKRCSQTHRTAEPFAEFQALDTKNPRDRARKDEIKDNGGFTIGYLAGGKRKVDAVMHKQAGAFDADYALAEFIAIVKRVFPNVYWFIYTTHSHSPNKPRYRLVMLFSRPLSAAEYEPVCRRIAELLGIDQFDPTTYDLNRLMYWPSTSTDGEFIFKDNVGQSLDVDEILASYKDWENTAEWPLGERETKEIRSKVAKAEDPLLKADWIGAYNRTYTVPDAIDQELPSVYRPCDVDNRYTYIDGSGFGGLIVYSEKFAYSHHGTDPIGDRLCNAFDLVRIHKFRHLDENARPNTPPNRLPSYSAMMEYIQKDRAVKQEYQLTKLGEAAADFDDVDWLGRLEMEGGKIKVTVSNLHILLDNDPATKGLFIYDLHAQREILTRLPDWSRKSSDLAMTDSDEHQILEIIERKYKMSGIDKKLNIALSNIFSNNCYHPIKDYLNSCVWDGVKRLDTLFIDYFGAEDTEYIRAVTRKTLIASIARVFLPGVKFDYVLVLVGPQGIGKSTVLAILGGEWFSDSFGDLSKEKSAEESLQGVWIMELGELAGLRKNDANRIKHFISKQVDRYRVSYGKRTEPFPRQCIFAGTTNDSDFLSDPTGNRRFWPIVVPGRGLKSVWDDLPLERDQIWAEAMVAFKAGEVLYLPAELEAQANAYQSAHTAADEWEAIIKEYLDKPLPENWRTMNVADRRAYLDGAFPIMQSTSSRDRVSTPEIWTEALRGEKKDLHNHIARRIKNVMRKISDWAESDGKIRIDGASVRGFVRTTVSGNSMAT